MRAMEFSRGFSVCKRKLYFYCAKLREKETTANVNVIYEWFYTFDVFLAHSSFPGEHRNDSQRGNEQISSLTGLIFSNPLQSYSPPRNHFSWQTIGWSQSKMECMRSVRGEVFTKLSDFRFLSLLLYVHDVTLEML